MRVRDNLTLMSRFVRRLLPFCEDGVRVTLHFISRRIP